MRVLVVARYKERGFAPFVTEQVEVLKEMGVECRFFPVRSKGIVGYLRQVPALCRAIWIFKPNIVHAHYGLVACLPTFREKFLS